MSEVMYCPTCGAAWYSAIAHSLVGGGARCQRCGGPLAHRDLGAGDSARVELAKAYYEAWGRGDEAAAVSILHPQVELHPAPELRAGDPVFRGLEGARRLWTRLAELWDGLTPVPRVFRDLDRDHLMVVTAVDARSRTDSELHLSGPATCLLRLEDGKLRSERMRLAVASDLETAGLWPG